MSVKISSNKRNKISLYFLILFVFPVFYNKLGYKLTWNRLVIWSMGFLLLFLIMFVYLLVSLVYISYVRHTFRKNLGGETMQPNILAVKFLYYCCAVVPLLLLFVGFTSIWIWDRPEFWDMLWMNMIWRISILALILLAITYLFDKYSDLAVPIFQKETVEVIREVKVKEEVIREVEVIIKEEVVKEIYVEKAPQTPFSVSETSILPKKIALTEMYTYLVHVAGVGPLYKDLWMIRFFDIVGIKTQNRQRHVIFSDGSMVLCNDILKILEAAGLRHWLVKISDNYMINTILVDFPYYKKGSQLILHLESMNGLRRKMSAEDIASMLTFGKGISDKNIKALWERRNTLVHDGWDKWIPIRK
ncbi:hypothetical protein HCX49_01990 [Sphingobacterium kitahiroshimense]|uniref:hypothetical protein n=1 Tax=Sphingobacterium sp. B16(2022) TaxID=2914044 RepID=UPI00143C6B4F|nr:hypothetical protein [Sphingobacterium sp. B16(2022)]NJI71967.1 hypothetical protein [Sphingobacterium sp. B16(2022)]